MKADVAPPCFYLSLTDATVLIDSAVNLIVGTLTERYALRGVIYEGEEHFTCRIIKPNGDAWYHDGIDTGRECVFEGSVHTSTREPSFLNTCVRGETVKSVTGVIYARAYTWT
ncbi:hypothetical protein B0H13DRAFT_1599006 [Mycena leptocephala]|nr:hypothetical protein B0H13DRAFT_1599006 [Mycena leptocephala]